MYNKKFELVLVLFGTIILLTACISQNKEEVADLNDKKTEVIDLEVKQTLDVFPEIWIAIGATICIEPQFQGFVNPEVVYISEDPTIASVDEGGNIKANELGETDIYVLIHSAGENDYMIKSIAIKVEFLLHAIDIDPEYVNITEGQEVSIDIKTFPQEAKKYADLTFEVSNEDCFSFDINSCKIKGIKEGRGILNIIYKVENIEISGQCIVNVKGELK